MNEAPGRGARGRAVALAAMLGLLLVQLLPLRRHDDAPFWNELLNAGHVPLFAGVTLLLFTRLHRAPGVVRYALAGGGTLVAAALVEAIQPYFARTRSLDDLLAGAAGIALALLGLLVTRHPRAGIVGRVAFAGIACSACALVLAPAFRELEAVLWRTSSFPVLGAFESEIELRLWRPQGGGPEVPTTVRLAGAPVRAGLRSLEVRAGARAGSAAPGVQYLAGDENWEPFHELTAQIYNPGGPLGLSLRIDDDGDTSDPGSRFGRRLLVEHGWSEIRITTAEIRDGVALRSLNLRAIRRLILFTSAGEGPRVFYLDDVRLRTGRPPPER